MVELTKKDEAGSTWYPVSVDRLDDLLAKVIQSGYGYVHTYALRRNIAYSLQHIEFLDRCLCDLKLSSVLRTQTWKTMILVGCSVIESLLHYLLVKRDLHAKDRWKLEYIALGNERKVDSRPIKIDSHVYSKLDRPQPKEMTFDAMLKRARKRKVLGSNDDLYVKLDHLRQLRNRVHLQAIEDPADTDWNAFGSDDVAEMAEVIFEVFSSTIFRPSAAEREYFGYLTKYFT